MNKDEIISLLKQSKEKEAQLEMRKIEKRKKEIQLEYLKQEEYKINITPAYTEGMKSNIISSKVEKLVINKDSEIERLEKEIKEIEKEIELLELDVKINNIVLGTLTYLEKEILIDYYVNEMSLTDIGNLTYYRIRQQTRGEKTIKRMIERAFYKLEKI